MAENFGVVNPQQQVLYRVPYVITAADVAAGEVCCVIEVTGTCNGEPVGTTKTFKIPLSGYKPPALSDRITAIPGIQGCGVETTTGGRGGETRIVTSRNDSGPGSFRTAISGNAPKNIIFAVGGDIDVSTAGLIAGENTSIWGQTAPAQGVSVTAVPNNTFGNAMFRTESNFVTTHMRYRNLPATVATAPNSRDAVRHSGANVVSYRNSISWGQDENNSFDVNNIFYAENIVGEGLGFSTHDISLNGNQNGVNNAHSYGGIAQGASHTYLRNLWISNRGRNLRIAPVADFCAANNWTHNYETSHWRVDDDGNSFGDIINNVITGGPDSPNNPDLIDVRQDGVYVEGNSVGAEYGGGVTPATERQCTCPSSGSELPLGQVQASITATSGAGATIAQGRDAVDTRLMSEANAGTGSITDCVNSLQVTPQNNNCARSVTYSGLTAVNSNPLIDVNSVDGVPNAWKIASGGAALHGNNYNTHNEDSNSDGYTDFEDWIYQTFGV